MSRPAGSIRLWSSSGAINAATAVDLRTPKNSTSTVYVTKFVVSITAHANAKLVQLQDSTGTPVVFAKRLDLTAAAGVPDCVVWDFGTIDPDNGKFGGIPMSIGKKAQGVSEAAGPTGYFYAEGYEVDPLPTSN
jgi:hypothetical protein